MPGVLLRQPSVELCIPFCPYCILKISPPSPPPPQKKKTVHNKINCMINHRCVFMHQFHLCFTLSAIFLHERTLEKNGLIRQNCRSVGQDQTTCSVQLFIFRRSVRRKFHLARPFTRATKSRRPGGGRGHGLPEKKWKIRRSLVNSDTLRESFYAFFLLRMKILFFFR